MQLLFGQTPVQAVGGHQFLVGSSAGDPSLLGDGDLIGFQHCGQAMDDDQGGSPFIRFFNACWMYISDSLSRLEVASSNRRIRGFRRKAIAISTDKK